MISNISRILIQDADHLSGQQPHEQRIHQTFESDKQKRQSRSRQQKAEACIDKVFHQTQPLNHDPADRVTDDLLFLRHVVPAAPRDSP